MLRLTRCIFVVACILNLSRLFATMPHQFIWLELNENGYVETTTLICLEEGGNVVWDWPRMHVGGTWTYHVDYNGSGRSFFAIEFSASGRHLMEQFALDKFRLLDVTDELYKDTTGFWDVNSAPYKNKKAVGMQRIHGEWFIDSSYFDETHSWRGGEPERD